MIAHQAKRVQAAREPLGPFLKSQAEASAVSVIEEDRLTGVAAEGDMIESPGIVESWLSRHGAILQSKSQYREPGPASFSGATLLQ
jgi:hypothetical protein